MAEHYRPFFPITMPSPKTSQLWDEITNPGIARNFRLPGVQTLEPNSIASQPYTFCTHRHRPSSRENLMPQPDTRLWAPILFVLLFSSSSVFAQPPSPDLLTGDKRLACEAIMCLSSGTRPSECASSLSRYFGIHKRKLSKTISARHDFLKLCPAASTTPEMSDLVHAMSHGAGRCDVSSLNRDLARRAGGVLRYYLIIDNRLPSYCSSYLSHQYADLDGAKPRYVGTPGQGGYWVEAKDYEREQANYQQAQARRHPRDRNQYLGFHGGD
ncbi:MAG: TrbM/KikA/MpfK family conjugal transfer protein [Achromobacter sp.]|uniref:TrbM/KikA/MpfK family conjugal transfer protein n=1 Tax=Achromobacter sp. TaxID=134375 RepID=UPI003D02A22B